MSRDSGHVKLVERKRGPVFYAKFRVNGAQTTRLIGPAWLKRARQPEGHFTRAMAEVELYRLMDEAASSKPSNGTATFGDACDEWLRYLGEEKPTAATTLRHNRSAVNARLIPFFGEDTPLGDVTTGRIDAYRVNGLVERGLAPSTVQGKAATLLRSRPQVRILLGALRTSAPTRSGCVAAYVAQSPASQRRSGRPVRRRRRRAPPSRSRIWFLFQTE